VEAIRAIEEGAAMKRAFVIIRLSTQDQLKGYGADVQWEDDVLSNASLLGLTVSETNRRVIQESAKSWERTKFETAVREVLSLYQNGRVEALLFPRVDRETRFLFGSVSLLAEALRAGIPVYFAREKLSLDPNDPESVERYLNKATQSQAYIDTMKTNTLQAKAKLLRKGILPQGTGIGLYGFNWNKKNKKRIPLNYEVKAVQKAFTMRDEGIGFFNIAKNLNNQGILTKSGSKWYPFTVRRMLTNPAYIGLTYFGKTSGSKKTKLSLRDEKDWKLLPDVTPQIIDEELFWRVQEKIKRSKEMHAALPHREYLLTGHIVCMECGSPVVGACLSRKHRYYHCRNTSPTSVKGKACNARYIRADYIEDMVWKNVRDILENPEVIITELKRQADEHSKQSLKESYSDKEIVKLEKKIRNYGKQERQLISLLGHGEVTKDYVLDEINRLKNECQADEQELQRIKEAKDRLSYIADAEIKLNEFCQRVRHNLRSATIQDKRLALEALDIRITASNQRMDIKGIVPVEFPTSPSSTDVTTIAQTSACLHESKTTLILCHTSLS
jgi:site-specific DNA recombinase